ncbi:Dihydropteroate synthase [Coprinopsis marcescibilis]|uniref:Dihydropteroate synthase n=1 Tax=Coprinopsis marcescibilis TaxID=230819 RepID=A0A5C3L9T7_COPMA|nr:Dihydropteroate synthase [Coprinopsis marcescibilis]
MASSQDSKDRDVIVVNDLTLLLPLATGAQWQNLHGRPPVLQPISISLHIDYDIRTTAATDDLSCSIDYAQLVDQLRDWLCSDTFRSFSNLHHIVQVISKFVTQQYSGVFESYDLKVSQVKAPAQCNRVSVFHRSAMVHNQWRTSYMVYSIEDLLCPTIVGVEPQERVDRQTVIVNCKIENTKENVLIEAPDLRALVKQIYEVVYHSNHLTIESLASSVAKGILTIVASDAPVKVIISVAKPHALPLARSAEVIISRTPEDYAREGDQERHSTPETMTLVPQRKHIAVLALGSNLGDRFRNIELALRLLEVPGELLHSKDPENAHHTHEMEIAVVDTSFLYETAPMYVTDQPSFINCACVIETNVSPLTLLHLVKTVEKIVGRVPSIRNGPRAVDLDIILYDNDIFDSRPAQKRQNLDDLEGYLVVPHPRLAEREFVLRPLNDILPDYVHPLLNKAISQLLQELEIPLNEPPMQKIIPFPRLPHSDDEDRGEFSVCPAPPTLEFWNHGASKLHFPRECRTHLMATLNTTPDSFSDGSSHNDIPRAMEYVRQSVLDGASIIDIGGYSTRPGAVFVSIEEEIDRVVPYIKAIRKYGADEDQEQRLVQRIRNVVISVDTFRWQVAEAALVAGANCINDVYAFTGPNSYKQEDEEEKQQCEAILECMKTISREHAVPVVLMHSRGDAGQNKDYAEYNYVTPEESVVEGVRLELGAKVDRIVKGKGGIRRWLVIIDPGIGFSKSVEGNLSLLKHASNVTGKASIGISKSQRNPLFGYPQLIGVSRKSFLGTIIQFGEHGKKTEPKERDWATAAAVTCAVQQGASIVRVHNVGAMSDVVRVADALWA